MNWIAIFILLMHGQSFLAAQEGLSVNPVPTPTPEQYIWHQQERIMFVCLDPCTWQNREYDNFSTPLDSMVLPDLDTDQWCEAAVSWGAQEILFVAKHTGGFCWWQTETTEYSVKSIALHDANYFKAPFSIYCNLRLAFRRKKSLAEEARKARAFTRLRLLIFLIVVTAIKEACQKKQNEPSNGC